MQAFAPIQPPPEGFGTRLFVGTLCVEKPGAVYAINGLPLLCYYQERMCQGIVGPDRRLLPFMTAGGVVVNSQGEEILSGWRPPFPGWAPAEDDTLSEESVYGAFLRAGDNLPQ